MPLFPELEPLLREAFEEAEVGAVYVLPMLHKHNYNPRTHMARIVKRALGEVWCKLFQNLRSSRQRELQQIFPSHVVTKWLGNSAAVAEKFYLQVTDEHYDLAQQPREQGEAKPEAQDAKQSTAEPRNEKSPVKHCFMLNWAS